MEEWLSTGSKLQVADQCLSGLAVLLHRSRGSTDCATFMHEKLTVLLQEVTAQRKAVEEGLHRSTDLGTLHVMPVEVLDKVLILSGGQFVRGICRYTRARFDHVNSVLLLDGRRQNLGSISLTTRYMMEKLALSTPQLMKIQACHLSADSSCALQGALMGARQTLRILMMKDLVMDVATAPAIGQLYNLEVLDLDNCSMNCAPEHAATILTSALKGPMAMTMRTIKLSWNDPLNELGLADYGAAWLQIMLPSTFSELNMLTSFTLSTSADGIGKDIASALTHMPLLELLKLYDDTDSPLWCLEGDGHHLATALQKLHHLRHLEIQNAPFNISNGSAEILLYALGCLDKLQSLAISFYDDSEIAGQDELHYNEPFPLDVDVLYNYLRSAKRHGRLKQLELDLTNTPLSAKGRSLVMSMLISDGTALEQLILRNCGTCLGELSLLGQLPNLHILALYDAKGPLITKDNEVRQLTTVLRLCPKLQRLYLQDYFQEFSVELDICVPHSCIVVYKNMTDNVLIQDFRL